MTSLRQPIAVFDAGLGSYSAVELLHRRLPDRDIVYLADRASFPYGAKTRTELLTVVDRAVRFLAEFTPSAILLASNAPSVTILDDLHSPVPIFGVRPPIAEALAIADEVAVLGVRSLVESAELTEFLCTAAGAAIDRVHAVNASALVELVESGDFLFRREHTASAISDFLDALLAAHPAIDAITLSSTHLPWLRDYFERARPELHLFDPIEAVVDQIRPLSVPGTGTVLGLVTENERYPATEFREMLRRLAIDLEVESVVIL
ncbi:aspartate/glutamate racemase family protein [Nocardia ninae]|uniref:Glutamate racemase n=1 Tax=Nocardia ninae NBRC 108245 TaxID=1210091 RepID=A0A511MTR2_9NOCA|nr:aspartate/glutamate racemase family protein [Nocardia ninae]GEM43608.1 glutamate racemase [Nocardia ninae NBRC 108245]